jgi:hypothetical protein
LVQTLINSVLVHRATKTVTKFFSKYNVPQTLHTLLDKVSEE